MTPGRAVSARISRTGEPATPRSREARGGGGTLGTAADGTGKGTSEVAASRTATARAAGGPRRRLRRWCAVLGRRPSPRSYRPTGAPGSLEAEGGARAQRRLQAAQRPRHERGVVVAEAARPRGRGDRRGLLAQRGELVEARPEVAAIAPGLELRRRGGQSGVELEGGLAQPPGVDVLTGPQRQQLAGQRRVARAQQGGQALLRAQGGVATAGAAGRRELGGRELDGAPPAALGDVLARPRPRRGRPAPGRAPGRGRRGSAVARRCQAATRSSTATARAASAGTSAACSQRSAEASSGNGSAAMTVARDVVTAAGAGSGAAGRARRPRRRCRCGAPRVRRTTTCSGSAACPRTT